MRSFLARLDRAFEGVNVWLVITVIGLTILVAIIGIVKLVPIVEIHNDAGVWVASPPTPSPYTSHSQ